MNNIKFIFLVLGILFLILPSVAGAQTGCYDKGFGVVICEGDTVRIKNDSNEDRVGTAREVFSDGMIRVDYVHSGSSYTLFREARFVDPAVPCVGGICQNAQVHLYNDSNEHRSGAVTYVFADGTVYVTYQHEGSSYSLSRNVTQVGYSVTCSSDICKGDRVHFLNDSNERRSGDVLDVYSDGYVKVQYNYGWSTYILYRRLENVSRRLFN